MKLLGRGLLSTAHLLFLYGTLFSGHGVTAGELEAKDPGSISAGDVARTEEKDARDGLPSSLLAEEQESSNKKAPARWNGFLNLFHGTELDGNESAKDEGGTIAIADAFVEESAAHEHLLLRGGDARVSSSVEGEDEEQATRKTTRSLGEGDSCSDSAPCADGHYCNGDTSYSPPADLKCFDGSLGDFCTDHANCQSRMCYMDLDDGWSRKKCFDGSLGDFCALDQDCQSGMCYMDLWRKKRCSVAGLYGDACEGGSQGTCADGLYCTQNPQYGTGQCFDGSLRDLCADHQDCQSGMCFTDYNDKEDRRKKCSAGLVLGDPCNDGFPCADGHYCSLETVHSKSYCFDGSVGDVCSDHQNCQSGMCYMEYDGYDGAKKCSAGLERDFCQDSQDHDSCADGLYCTQDHKDRKSYCFDGSLNDLCADHHECQSGMCYLDVISVHYDNVRNKRCSAGLDGDFCEDSQDTCADGHYCNVDKLSRVAQCYDGSSGDLCAHDQDCQSDKCYIDDDNNDGYGRKRCSAPPPLSDCYSTIEKNCWKSGNRLTLHGIDPTLSKATLEDCTEACKIWNNGVPCEIIEFGPTWGCFACNPEVDIASLDYSAQDNRFGQAVHTFKNDAPGCSWRLVVPPTPPLPSTLSDCYFTVAKNCWKSGNRLNLDGIYPTLSKATLKDCTDVCKIWNNGVPCKTIEFGPTWGCFACNPEVDVFSSSLDYQAANTWGMAVHALKPGCVGSE